MNIKKLSKLLIPLALILPFTSCTNSAKASNNLDKKNTTKTNISISESKNKKIDTTSKEDKKNNESDNLVEESLNYLTSNECNGRRYNTEGNKKAQDFIIDKFEEIGLEKYHDSYMNSYNHPIVKFTEHDVILNDKHSFEIDKDFIVSSFNNKLLSLPISFNSDHTDECIFVCNDSKKLLPARENKNVKAILYANNNGHKGLPILNVPSDKLFLNISQDMFKTLKNTEDGNLKLKFDYLNCDIKDNNIVGKITGTNTNSALVLSAHFDHVGSSYDEIWTGALDNASGDAVLLDVASAVQKLYSSNKPNCDIIFCALNSEEAGMYGSRSFASNLREEYENIININLDSLGQKNSEILYIDDDNNVDSETINFIQDFFKEKDYKVSLRKEEYTSDHLSFIDNNILSYNLTTLAPFENYEYLHTPKDTIEKLDMDYLNNLSINLQELMQKLIDTSTLLNKKN